MIRWYAAYTQHQAEARAAQELWRQGFDFFLPMHWRLRRHARRRETVLRPLFPRYLFVAIDLKAQRWRAINGTRGVVELVHHGGHPAPAPIGMVEALRDRVDRCGAVPLDSLAIFEPGRNLLVTSGPLAGRTGRYESTTDDDRVVLLLDLLGRNVRVVVPLLDVDAA